MHVCLMQNARSVFSSGVHEPRADAGSRSSKRKLVLDADPEIELMLSALKQRLREPSLPLTG